MVVVAFDQDAVLDVAPARPRATRCRAFTARLLDWGDLMSLKRHRDPSGPRAGSLRDPLQPHGCEVDSIGFVVGRLI
jgi:hypothetical protein